MTARAGRILDGNRCTFAHPGHRIGYRLIATQNPSTGAAFQPKKHGDARRCWGFATFAPASNEYVVAVTGIFTGATDTTVIVTAGGGHSKLATITANTFTATVVVSAMNVIRTLKKIMAGIEMQNRKRAHGFAETSMELGWRGLKARDRLRSLAASMFLAMLVSGCNDEAYVQTGKVLHAETRQPIEGAFVLSTYIGCPASKEINLSGIFMGHVGSGNCRCENSVGMFTGPDGAFSFPLHDEAGRRLSFPTAIKPDFRYVKVEIVNSSAQSTDQKKFWSEQNILIAPQNSAAPELNFQSHEADCQRAQTRQQGAAGQTFLRFELAEREEYGVWKSDPTWKSILRLDALATSPGDAPLFGSAEAEKRIVEEDSQFSRRLREAEEDNQRIEQEVSLSILRLASNRSCVRLASPALAAKLADRVTALGIKTYLIAGQEKNPCVDLSEEDEVRRLASTIAVTYRALEKKHLKRYPKSKPVTEASARKADFSMAVVGGDVKKAATLIDAGVDPSASIDTGIDRYLHVAPIVAATMLGHADMAALLAKHGANLNASDWAGETPLHFLARNGLNWDAATRAKLAKTLLEGAANPNVVSNEKEGPLTLAAERGNVELVRQLIAKGADPNQSGGSSMNPLNAALRFLPDKREPADRQRLVDIAEQLVIAGAKITPSHTIHDQVFKQRLLNLESSRNAGGVAK